MRCAYCGSIYRPSGLDQTICRCANHPSVMAVGKCNDCGEDFCENCLRVYNIYDRTFGSEMTKLYLCPDCLKRRYANRTRAATLGGTLILALGLLTLIIFVPVAPQRVYIPLGFPAILGTVILFYGLWQRNHVSEDDTVYTLRLENERTREETLAADADFEVEDAYDELIGHYATKWGAQEGLSLFEMEIAAQMRSGDTFAKAVEKIYFRQLGRLPSKRL